MFELGVLGEQVSVGIAASAVFGVSIAVGAVTWTVSWIKAHKDMVKVLPFDNSQMIKGKTKILMTRSGLYHVELPGFTGLIYVDTTIRAKRLVVFNRQSIDYAVKLRNQPMGDTKGTPIMVEEKRTLPEVNA